MTKNKKFIRAIPGLIVGSIMTGIIIWGITSDKRCEELMKKEDCITQMVFSFYSKDRLFGNGSRGVTTGYYMHTNGENSNVSTNEFAKSIVDGTPIIVRFSPQCPDCYEFLWDSAFVYNGNHYRYFYIEDVGYDYEITKVTN